MGYDIFPCPGESPATLSRIVEIAPTTGGRVDMEAGNLELEIRFNGQSVGHVSVPVSASRRDKELAAMSHPEVQKRLGEATIKGLSIVDDGVVNILV
jgi:leucyl-tRNA synthetase